MSHGYLLRKGEKIVVFSSPVRYSFRKSNEYCTNIFLQDYIWSSSIHSYSSLFSWPVRYSNRKSNEYRTNQII